MSLVMQANLNTQPKNEKAKEIYIDKLQVYPIGVLLPCLAQTGTTSERDP